MDRDGISSNLLLKPPVYPPVPASNVYLEPSANYNGNMPTPGAPATADRLARVVAPLVGATSWGSPCRRGRIESDPAHQNSAQAIQESFNYSNLTYTKRPVCHPSIRLSVRPWEGGAGARGPLVCV